MRLSLIPIVIKRALASVAGLFFFLAPLSASPSSLFWTNCTTDVQEFGTANLNIDNYFTVFNRHGHGSAFPPDVGITFGVFDFHALQSEAGFDYLGGTDDPLYFNGKIGMKEGAFGTYVPSWSFGIFNCGTRYHGHNKTDQNILNFVLGKEVPKIGGNFFVALFSGSRAMVHDREGVMVGYKREFGAIKDTAGNKYNRFAFAADYASGRSTIGGGGFALQYFFTKDIAILTGPVWFNNRKINGRWKWSVQLDIGLG